MTPSWCYPSVAPGDWFPEATAAGRWLRYWTSNYRLHNAAAMDTAGYGRMTHAAPMHILEVRTDTASNSA